MTLAGGFTGSSNAGAGGAAFGETPSTEITGRLATSIKPYWLLKLRLPPYDCCCPKPPIWWSSVSYTVTRPLTSMAKRRAWAK
ncbi:hypothetical protein [Variovorax sp. J22R115]|uniref:hypothetical protein n=1 Tax=Variovorax sp. J22R115 TaxID=3053509 RepID=UPI0034E005F8